MEVWGNKESGVWGVVFVLFLILVTKSQHPVALRVWRGGTTIQEQAVTLWECIGEDGGRAVCGQRREL